MRRISKFLVFIFTFVSLFSSLAMPALANAEGTDGESTVEEYLSDNLLPNGDFAEGLKFWVSLHPLLRHRVMAN